MIGEDLKVEHWELILLFLSFAAEAAVAWAIVSESETTRRSHFIERTTKDERNKDRAAIYCTFLETKAADRKAQSREFVKTLWLDETLKRQCDSQIEMLNDLGLIIGSGLRWSEDFYVEIFPHAAVYMWVILEPYLKQRRDDAGPLFAKPMLTFMKKCVTLLINQGHEIKLRNRQGDIGMMLTPADLRTVRAEIDDELARV